MTENHRAPADSPCELLPCPFCNGAVKTNDGKAWDEGWSVECEKCWLTMGCFETESEAIAAWNTRAAPPVLSVLDPRDEAIIGLYEKYRVTRTDGKSAPGSKHADCEYFVLDLTHDPHAYAAIDAYARSCKDDYPALANDLWERAKEIANRGRTK